MPVLEVSSCIVLKIQTLQVLNFHCTFKLYPIKYELASSELLLYKLHPIKYELASSELSLYM
jgi:hypothetical protein